MESIELDPASCPIANTVVRAERIYTLSDNGYSLPWSARSVWCNPPGGFMDGYGRLVIHASKKHKRPACVETGSCGLPAPHTHTNVRPAAGAYWDRMVRLYVEGHVGEAIFIGFTIQLLQTTQQSVGNKISALDFPRCYPRQRIAYDRPSTGGARERAASPPHASVIIYLPLRSRYAERVDAFCRAYNHIGKVCPPSYSSPKWSKS